MRRFTCDDFAKRLFPGEHLTVTVDCLWNQTWKNDPSGYTCQCKWARPERDMPNFLLCHL